MTTYKLRAIFRKCTQIGPDDWEMETRVMDLKPTTQIHEIVWWYKNQMKSSHRNDFFQLTITGERVDSNEG